MDQDNIQLEPKIFDFQSDSQGKWDINIGGKFEPGPHVVTVEDEQGNSYQVMMYVVGEETTPTFSPTNLMPLGFIYAFLSLFVIILLLIAYIFKLAREADKEAERAKLIQHRKSQTKKAIVFCTFILLITVFSGLLMNRDTNFVGQIIKGKPEIMAVKVMGTIINPLTLQGVADVDLKNNSTLIKTPIAGQYIFDGVDPKIGIHLTYPGLTKALALIPPAKNTQERFDLYFDAEMFNILIAAIDFESRGQFSRVWELMPQKAKENVSLEKFLTSAKSIFSAKNVPDQELKISETKIIDRYYSTAFDVSADKAVEINVLADNQTDKYILINTEEGWKIIK